jgi:microcystin-dependent protein
MGEPYVAEIRIMSFNFSPKGWAACDGALLPINQNQALYALLGTTYGGNGQTNFALPNLAGKVPMHKATSANGGHTQGETGGSSAVTLTTSQLPTHTHVATGTQSAATTNLPPGMLLANVNLNAYAQPGPLQNIAPDTLVAVGGSQPHNNMSPYLELNFCIALQGFFPTQN